MASLSFAQDELSGEDLLSGLRSPFIQKLPKMMKKIEEVVDQVQDLFSSKSEPVEVVQPPPEPVDNGLSRWEMELEKSANDGVGNTDSKIRPTFNLSGVMWNVDNPMAIINGQVVGVGDYVETVLVMDISPSEVFFDDGVSTFSVPIQDRIAR